MIIIYHDHRKATSVYDQDLMMEIDLHARSLSALLFELAARYNGRLLVWCSEAYRNQLNINLIPQIFNHKRLLISYCPGGADYLPEAIGYVEDSSFIKICKEVTYPTWRMSSVVGGIYSDTLLVTKDVVTQDEDFDYFLSSLSRSVIAVGMFCYSEPQLLTESFVAAYIPKASNWDLFRFVGQHFKKQWVLMLFANMLINERKFPLAAAICSLFTKRRQLKSKIFEEISIESSKDLQFEKTIDVVIPTLGRKKYLHDVLLDIAQQSVLPRNVIIIEQNPDPESTTELDYLNHEWPFSITHRLIHQTGACNARNVALKEVKSDWVFLADDDIRLTPTFIEEVFQQIYQTRHEVFSICCILPGQKPLFDHVHQTPTFSAGSSVISRASLGDSAFGMAYEFGYGEDSDFGMQLTNKGYDTYHLPYPQILHLKAPSGGFRSKVTQEWDNEVPQPKPSPTVLLYRILHHSKQQLLGYRTILFLKFYKQQQIKNPFAYLKAFRIQWKKSVYWAQKLKTDHNL
ncbi:MAG TPA: glycosyltransferase [Flavobacterium sp.]|jgi:glycosyltransferase involved in cell wall biosynthesis